MSPQLPGGIVIHRSKLSENAGAGKIMRRIRKGALTALMLVAAPVMATAQEDTAQDYVNPELRSMAQRLLQSNAPTVAPTRVIGHPAPLPPGVEERLVPGGNGQPPVPVYI